MVFTLLALGLVAGAGRLAHAALALWRRIPRSNADFRLF